MPVVYGLVQSHNGFIDIQSELGKGTSVSLFLPIPDGAVPRLSDEPRVFPKAVQGSETVLIVDDEPDVSYFVEVILKQHGYHVLTAGSAEEALEKLRDKGNKVDLLFSDIGLPQADGFKLSAEAKALRPGLKIMVTSGYVDSSLKTRMADAGIHGFLAKPYDTNDMLENIRAVLDK